MPSGSLLIISPSLEDEGYFECTVTNEVGEERKVIEVMLQGINQINSKVNIQCPAVSNEMVAMIGIN